MLTTPPKPPKPSMTKARPVASTVGCSQGRAAIQPNRPRLPRIRPAISMDALMVKMVSSVGTVTSGGQRHLEELERRAVLRVHEQVVHADGQAVEQEEDEAEPP